MSEVNITLSAETKLNVRRVSSQVIELEYDNGEKYFTLELKSDSYIDTDLYQYSKHFTDLGLKL